jgi:hypothetical protein
MISHDDQVFLIATYGYSDEVFNKYKNISRAVSGYGKVFLLYHQKESIIPAELDKMHCHLFTDAILHNLSYTPLTNTLVPGSNHFPLLDFFRNNAEHKFYWYIEDDVCFNGSWKRFFDSFSHTSHDFISSFIKKHEPGSQWPWWGLSHPQFEIKLENRLRSFNPVYRISQAALSFIHHSLTNKWQGHHEVLLPTLLFNNRFSIMDFGGAGEFIQPSGKNRFYTSRTFRWKPAFKKTGCSKNKLYHPVKPAYRQVQQTAITELGNTIKNVHTVYLQYQSDMYSQVIILYKKNKRYAIKTLVNNQANDSENWRNAYEKVISDEDKNVAVITRSKGTWKEIRTDDVIVLNTAGKEAVFFKKCGEKIFLTNNQTEDTFYRVSDKRLERKIILILTGSPTA